MKAFLEMLNGWKQDLDRYILVSPDRHWLLTLILARGLWVSAQYRFSRWVHFHVHIPLLRQALKIYCFFGERMVEIMTGVEMPNRASIGHGLFIPHPNGIIIHIDAKLGNNCDIGQQVTIGIGGREPHRGVPKMGDRIYIGPGAKIFGPITIGNDVAIGANAVVTKDLPDNAVAVGIPAKIISYKGSQGLLVYRKKNRLV